MSQIWRSIICNFSKFIASVIIGSIACTTEAINPAVIKNGIQLGQEYEFATLLYFITTNSVCFSVGHMYRLDPQLSSLKQNCGSK